MAGQVEIMLALAPEPMPPVKSGKLKAQAITTSKRTSPIRFGMRMAALATGSGRPLSYDQV